VLAAYYMFTDDSDSLADTGYALLTNGSPIPSLIS